jgi:hypothetical protein
MTFLGGTGNLPVPLGCQPGGMGEIIRLQTNVRLLNKRLTRSGRLVADRHRPVACATHANQDTTGALPATIHIFSKISVDEFQKQYIILS